jgi:hypothetical protein
MKTFRISFVILLMLVAVVLTACKKEEKPVLSNSYSGTLTFEYSRGFPDFKAVSTLSVSLGKDGVLTSGTFTPASFDQEKIKFEATKPVLKIHVAGTVKLDAAKGNYAEIAGADKVLVYIHSIIEGSMQVYGWDDDLGFILVMNEDFTYEDEYADGTWEFSLDDAVIMGSTISTTLPDIEGSSTYGYTLFLVPLP